MFNEALFRGKMAEKQISKKELAIKLGISREALRRRISQKGEFRRSEISKLREIFGKEDADSFLFANSVAKTQLR